MPNVTNQVRLRTGLELKHPASKQAVLMNRQGDPPSTQEAGRTHGVPAGPSVPSQPCPKQRLFAPLEPLSSPTELPPAGPSQDTWGMGHSPCPSAETRPENRLPLHMKTCAKSRGISLGVSHFIPIFDSENVLNILKRS